MADPTAHPPDVRAAGGVVWRTAVDGLQILVVHRPRYDDWSLPKGKLDPGETFAQAALREIAEETGVRGTLGADLGAVSYVDHKGRPKVVRWWAIRADHVGAPTASPDEVDDVRWVDVGTAASVLTHDTDAEVVRRFLTARSRGGPDAEHGDTV